MSELPDNEEAIEEVASTWLALRAEGFSTAQKCEFQRWLRADPRHAAAVTRLEEACALLEKMPLVRAELQPVVPFPVSSSASPRSMGRRRRFSVGRLMTAFAAMAMLAIIGWWQWARPQPKDVVYTTRVGGYERDVLADGSVVALNADTELRVSLRAHERKVVLVRGEAHFSVAHDTRRPFVVSAGNVVVRAVGTAFNVRLAPTAVEVLVTEGTVAVGQPAGAPASAEMPRADPGQRARRSPTLVTVNERMVVANARPEARSELPAPTVERIDPDLIRQALSWQERMIVFSETPLREVVAQFNRRNRLQLVLGDAAVAEQLVGGTFAANNVDGFIRLLESSGKITAERRDENTIVLRATR